MQRNSPGPQQEKNPEAPPDGYEQLRSPPVRRKAIRSQILPEPPTKLARRDLSFLNDDQHDQKIREIIRVQPRSRRNNQQEFQTDRGVSPEPVPVRVQYVEALPRRGSMESEKEPHISNPSPTPTVDVHVDPKTHRDVTLHLDMDVTEDVEEELEEFSRLRRIGHFKAAKRYFEEHLESCISNAYVLDQYGQFLLEIADFHTLTKLAREYPAGDVERAASVNWILVCERALQLDDATLLQGNRRETPSLRKLLKNWPNLDSTEFQCLINEMRIARAGNKYEFTDEEYGELYAHLQHEDRIWDFRDLCYSVMSTAPLEDAIHCIFNKHLSPQNTNAPGVVQIIQQHWGGSAEDEVTSLAMLDIFTAFTMWALDAANTSHAQLMDDSEELQTAKIYLDVAHHYANEVLRQNPLNLKSRPYLQWVVANVLVGKNTASARCGETTLAKYLFNLRGAHDASTGTFRGLLAFRDIVFYVPNYDEAPDWQPDSSITFSHEQEKAIQMVARNARELGDVLLEAACLQHLNYSSPSTEVYLVDLCNLWRSAGNRLGLLRAYLYRYILKRTTDASNDLRSDLLQFGDTQCRVELQKTRFMVLRALSTRPYEKATYLKRALDLEVEPHRSTYNERMPSPSPPPPPPPARDIESIYSAKNNGRQASIHSDQSYSDDRYDTTDHSDIDDPNKNGPLPLAVRPQSPSSYRFRRPTLDEEKTSQKNEARWLKEQHSPRRILAGPFNEAGQTELIPSGPATNILPVTLHSMETSKDSKHRKKNILGSDSRKTTKESRDGEDTIDLVDEQDKERREEKENDDADVSEIGVESLKPHVNDEEGKQEDVQSTGSQVGDHEASTVYRNPDGSRLRERFS